MFAASCSMWETINTVPPVPSKIAPFRVATLRSFDFHTYLRSHNAFAQENLQIQFAIYDDITRKGPDNGRWVLDVLTQGSMITIFQNDELSKNNN